MKSGKRCSELKESYVYAIRGFFEALDYYRDGIATEKELNEKLDEWERWEREYAKKGYKTLNHDIFYNAVMSGTLWESPESREYDHLGQKRNNGEEPVFYAAAFRERFPGMVKELSERHTLK